MVAAWPVKRMEDLCEITSSKRIFAADYVSEGVPFYRGREITEKYKGNLDVSTELFITEEKFREIERKFGAPMQGDLLLTSVGTLGSVYVVKPGDRFYFKDGNLTWFRHFKELDSQLLYYWIGSPQGKVELQKCTIGSSQSAFTIVLLKSMEIELPPLPIQQRIAGILSAYDELIEISQRRIRILESMARAIYREWFVHFRFPGFEHHPRVASLLGEIPQGWEVKPVADAFVISGGGTPSRKEDAFWEGGTIQWYSPSDLTGAGTMFMNDSSDHITERGLAQSSARMFPARSVMLTSRATIGAIAINTNPACTNQGFITCLPNDRVPLYFLFHWLKENVPTFQRMASGATFKEISRGVFKTIEFLQPPVDLVGRFEAIAAPMAEQVLALQRQVQNLRRTRDSLLPRLLSGQIALDVVEDDVRSQDAGPPPAVQVPLRSSTSNRTEIAKPEASENSREPSRPISIIEREEVLCTIRKVFGDGAERDRDTALRDIAYALGYQRLGTRIREELSADFMAAVRRGIVVNERGDYRLGFRSFAEYPRDTLKEAFESAIGRAWVTREDVIRAFARRTGFARVGEVIDQTARSLINGLIREGRVEADGPDLIRRT